MSDGDLARSAATGEEKAFTQLMRRHKDGLYRFIRRYVGSSDEAWDLLQQSFAAAWLALGRYDPARPFPTWLRRIALNKCRDWSRRRTLRRWLTHTVPHDGPAGAAVASPDLDPEATFAAREALGRLDRAIADLSPALKEPLILTALENMSHQDAGRLLGLSSKAVELRVYRARRRLAQILGDDANDGE